MFEFIKNLFIKKEIKEIPGINRVQVSRTKIDRVEINRVNVKKFEPKRFEPKTFEPARSTDKYISVIRYTDTGEVVELDFSDKKRI